MKKIIITENQLNVINEALGVPLQILDVAEDIYDIVVNDLKTITTKQDEYDFEHEIDFTLGDKKKIKIDNIEIKVNVENLLSDGQKPVLISMGMSQSFHFNRDIKMKVTIPSSTAELEITFAVGDEWEPNELYEVFVKDRASNLSSIAHEIKHKYDKQSKRIDLIGRDVTYQTIQTYGKFGIPAIDDHFMRYLYYVDTTENLVRAVEIASEIKSQNITKSKFYDFLKNQRVYKELTEIKNYTFDDLIRGMVQEMGRVDRLLEHVDVDYENMSESDKIKKVLEIVFNHLANLKMNLFIDYTTNDQERMESQIKQMLGLDIDPTSGEIGDVRKKFLKYVGKYKDDPTQFFKTEIENLNYEANKMLKKISKLYDLAKDDEPVSESIINWDLHQKLMEKKHGKMKIESKLKYKF
jgi:hypothetical protein